MNGVMTPTDIAEFWKKTADDDWDTANVLVTAQKYHHALFFCHLALEKLLKGLVYAKKNSHPLPIHDLVKLAHQTGIPVSDKQEEQLKEITSWNIKARYDDYKLAFYRKATKDFTTTWMQIVQDLFLWLKNQY